MKIVYLGHSGFSVRLAGRLLIFDALGGVRPEKKDRAVTLVSHSHPDHFWPEVRSWLLEGRSRLVTGEGLDAGGICLRRGESADVDGVLVRAFGSTDEGSSFLVETGGKRIFHAGDFNLWSWRDESTREEIDAAEQAFASMLEDMRGMRPDVAFFPVDPRMGTDFDEGAVRFAQAARPALLVPMHFWDRPQAAIDFARKPMPQGVCARALTVAGESVEWED